VVRRSACVLVTFLQSVLVACSGSPSSVGGPGDASTVDHAGRDAARDRDGGSNVPGDAKSPAPNDAHDAAHDVSTAVDAAHDVATAGDAKQQVDAGPCTTRVTYGSAWIRPANHPTAFDDVPGLVTWDGTCTDDAANSYATLSNGWKPYFSGNSACILALDTSGSCASAGGCTTKVTYGANWLAPAGHPDTYDLVNGRVFADGVCHASGADAYEALSNGWQPHFQEASGPCPLSFEYTQCGGLYENPVIPTDCPDPGVLYDDGQYVLVCTSGDAADAYPIYTSPDLVTWTPQGHVFPAGQWPTWAVSDFWAPEVHKVGSHYVVYFSARSTTGQLSIGAASAASPLGPFTDIGQPLIAEAGMGLIDASEINATGGAPYVLWKEDGNALGKPTPIHSQPLASDGLSLTGSAATLITNDEAWEGAVTEAPFMVANGGSYYLFYSGNSYANSTYAIGVARGASPAGPFTKLGSPVVRTGGSWVGPGHCAVVNTPAGDTYMVYAAWRSGCVNAAGCGRLVLTDEVTWAGWPSVPFAPSAATRPLP
jgi:arabinan endo-1,5-alpha-L-arabinosidase